MNTAQPFMPAGYASRVAATGIANGVVSAICAAFALPLLVGALGLARYGQWAVLGMFITTAAALDLGMTRAIVLHSAGQPPARVRECMTASMLIAGGFALLATLVIAIVSLTTGRLLGLASQAFDSSILVGGCLILTFSLLNGVLRAVLESQLSVHWVNVGYLLQTLILYGLTLLAAIFRPDSVIAASTAAFACVLVLHTVMLKRIGLLKPLRPTSATLREIFKTGRSSYLLAAPSALLPPLASMLVLSEVSDPGEYGVFDLAVRIATLASTLLASIAVPMLALSARAHATGAGATQLHGWVRRYLLAGWVLFAIGVTTFWLTGPWLLGLLFPAAGAALFPVALALMGGIGAVAASEPAIRAILGSHHTAPVLLGRFIMLGVVLFAGTWFLQRGGLAAFAMTYTVAGLMCTAIITGAWWLRQRAR